MNNKEDSGLEKTLKIATPLITVLGLLIGVWQFTHQQSANDKLEFKRKIWERKLDAYTQIGDLVAKIVVENDSKKILDLNKEFGEMYWGKMPLFEDDSVEFKMEEFKGELNDKLNGVTDIDNPDRLMISGYSLVKTCQKSLKDSWTELNK